MFYKSITIKHNNRFFAVKQKIRISILPISIITFLLFSLNVTAHKYSENIILHKVCNITSCDNNVAFSCIPFHQNIPIPIPEIPLDLDDKEEKDGLDDDLKIASKSFVLSGIAKNKILYALLFQSFQNRISISLVILYQSWKSFFI